GAGGPRRPAPVPSPAPDQRLWGAMEDEVGEPPIGGVAEPPRRLPGLQNIDLLVAVIAEINVSVGHQEFAAAILVDARPGRVGRRQNLAHHALSVGAQDGLAAVLLGARFAPIEAARL